MTTKRKPGPAGFVFAGAGAGAAAGISQAAPADMAGLRRPPVGSLESGERKRSIDRIERLSSALDALSATLPGGGAA